MDYISLLLKVILRVLVLSLVDVSVVSSKSCTFVQSFSLAVGRPRVLLWKRHFHSQRWLLQPSSDGSTITAIQSSCSSSSNIDDNDTYLNMHQSNEISRRQLMENIKRTTSMATTTAAALASWNTPSVQAATATDAVSSTTTTAVPIVPLGKSSLYVSKTIQGYWQLAGGHGKYRESDAIQNMIQHYQAGITTLDTADIYGPSEIIIGKFIHQQQQQTQDQVKNSNIIPMTKFCCFRYLEDIDRNEVRQRILKSCERLQVQKLPLVQFFWSRFDVKRYVDVALFLTELKEEGLIQEIGATNFDLKRLQELKNADVPIVSHQVQLSAIDRRPVQSGMADWCAENDISLIGFGTVGSGILSDRWLGRNAPTAEDKTTASLRMYSSTASRFGDWSLVQELLQTMDRIAKNVRDDGRCTLANISNVAQRYVLQTPAVASVLIGVRNTDHIQENLRTHTFQLNQGEIDAINAVVAKRKGPTGDVWEIERGSM